MPTTRESGSARTNSDNVRAGPGGSTTSKVSGDKLDKRVDDAISAGRSSRMIADPASERRARSWLTRMAKGSTVDLRTNLFIIKGKGKERRWKPYDVIAREWSQILDPILKGLPSQYQELLTTELESGNAEKMGPKSIYQGFYSDGPDKLRAVFSDKRRPDMLDMRRLSKARDRLVSMVPRQSIHLMSIDQAVNLERPGSALHDPEAPGLDPTTNSGPPFYLSRWKPHPSMARERFEYTNQVFSWILNRAKKYYTSLSRGDVVDFQAMVAQRTVSRGRDPLHDAKTKRLVIALEKAEAILWKLFTPQAQEVLRSFEIGGVQVFNAWCDAPVVDDNQQRMLKIAADNDLVVVSGDVAGFDASIVPEIWEYMGDGIADWFYKSSKFVSALHRSVINNVRALSPIGVAGPGPSSIKSGSGGTNFDDCMYNLLTLFYGEEMGFYKLLACEVQGDDFSAVGKGVEPEPLAEAYSHTNLTLHPEKQMYRKGALAYLQRVHVLGSHGGIASTYRVLNSTLVQEKTRFGSDEWNPYTEAIQAIAKLENAVFHPAFEQLVHYVAENDRFQLGRDLPASEVIVKAGEVAGEVLQASQSSFSANVFEKDKSGFINSPTNGVLRGEELPPHDGKKRFSRAYSSQRLALVN